jgi:NADH-quinone oxidoreductase subunit L
MELILKYLWLIPAFPLLAAAVTALAKQRHRNFAAYTAIGSMIFALGLSLFALINSIQRFPHIGALPRVYNFNWFQLGASWVQLGWVLDPLTAVMLVMVSFVGLLIFVYSYGYMAHDENFTRFFCFLSLFSAAMLGVVISNSLLLLFICWELVGLTSYLLIGFWYHKPSASAAAKKAFITTRIGDLALLLGMVWLYSQADTLLFYDHGHGCLERSALVKLAAQATSVGIAASTGIALLIFCGAVGKSGQVPLHVWLPDAMEGPTPVSALIHAATMVAAGVFLVARVYPLMANVEPPPPVIMRQAAEPQKQAANQAATAGAEKMAQSPKPKAANATSDLATEPGLSSELAPKKPVSIALKIITWVGAITALFAASIAVAQTDIKRILAFSTVSQLGFMMMGLGVGGVAVGMFHLITHAFFKALLFMGAGSVIHGCHEEQDIRYLGGLRKLMPVTFATYAIGMMALSGFPVIFSGFWSKDAILHAAHAWSISSWPFYLGVVGALLTAFYMTRQICYVFIGPYRSSSRAEALSISSDHAHAEAKSPAASHAPHESPTVMTAPLAILAVFAILLGFIGTPAWPWFQSFLTGSPSSFEGHKLVEPEVLRLMLLSVAIVAGGVGLGWFLYGRKAITNPEEPDVLERVQPEIFALLHRKYFVDEAYEHSIIALNAWWAKACDWLDYWVWNGVVQLVSYAILGLSWLNRVVDEYVVNLGFDEGCRQATLGGRLLSRLQDGRVQTYLRVIGIALTALVLVLIWGCRAS